MPFKCIPCVFVLGAVALVSACGGPAPQQTAAAPPDPAPINDLRSTYQTAYNAGDVAALVALYTDDAVMMPDRQPAVEGRGAIQTYYEQLFAQVSATTSVTPADTEISGDVAHEHGAFSFTATPKAGGDPIADTGKYLVVLKRGADGVWRIHREIGNSNAPPPGAPGQASQP